MKALLILMVSIFCLSACGGVVHSHNPQTVVLYEKVYVDAAFSKQEEDVIRASAKEWIRATNCIVQFDMVYGFDMSDTSPDTYLQKIMIKKLRNNDRMTRKIDLALNDGNILGDAEVLGYTLKKEEFAVIFIVCDRLLDEGKFDRDHLMNVVIHEQGHLLGMSHYDDTLAIMNASYDNELNGVIGTKLKYLTCFTKADIAQFCSLFYCDASKLHTCNE